MQKDGQGDNRPMDNPKPDVVCDTVIFLQAALSRTGSARRVLSLFEAGDITLFMSNELLEEIRDVLTRPVIRQKNPRFSEQDVENLIRLLEEKSVLLSDVPKHFQYARDPDDEHVINLTLEVRARYLISRDRDLLDLMNDQAFRERFPDLSILEPDAFLRELDFR